MQNSAGVKPVGQAAIMTLNHINQIIWPQLYSPVKSPHDGPVVLVTTAVGRRKNIMTISWTMVMDFTPKLAFVTGSWNHSYQALMLTKECVIAIPSADMSEAVVGIGTCSGADTDKFQKFGLTPVKAKAVKAPLIAECMANIECHVIDHVKKHNLFVLEGVRAWMDPADQKRRTFHAVGDGTFGKLNLHALQPGARSFSEF